MDFVVVHTVNGDAATEVHGPFATKEAAYEWAVAARAKQGFAEKHQTIGGDYLTWENEVGMKLDWHVLPFHRESLDSFHPIGVPLVARIDGDDVSIEEANGFKHGVLYDWQSIPTANLVKHLTGKTIEEHINRSHDFLHVESLVLRGILTGEQPITLPLLQMTVEYTVLAREADSTNREIPEETYLARTTALNQLAEAMANVTNYVDLYKREPTTMITDTLELLRKYWSI